MYILSIEQLCKCFFVSDDTVVLPLGHIFLRSQNYLALITVFSLFVNVNKSLLQESSGLTFLDEMLILCSSSPPIYL